ncbi:MAG: hypothetical protein WCA07_15560 [Gloeobacterales cyanobacterium]
MNHVPKWKKLTALSLVLILGLLPLGCAAEKPDSAVATNTTNSAQQQATTKLADGKYDVQQATYDDGTGVYTVFLLNSTPPTFRDPALQMARLTPEEEKAGQKGYLKVEGGKASLHIPEKFQISYVHNVTEEKTNPQTGQKETVVVRQESSFWTPFLGAMAGNMVANALFAPRYYMPPVYSAGGLRGYGGYGDTYDRAVGQYQSRYGTPPLAVKNQQALRTTGLSRNPRTDSLSSSTQSRSTGSGFGSSNLQRSNSNNQEYRSAPKSSGFGSMQRSRSFGGMKRR